MSLEELNEYDLRHLLIISGSSRIYKSKLFYRPSSVNPLKWKVKVQKITLDKENIKVMKNKLQKDVIKKF